ncbi:MAG: hypothetical protein ACRDGG_00940 [Anaerolineae bacterium]
MTLGVARDISLILLIVPTLICALVPAALAFGAWWATRRVRFALPSRIRQARTAVRRVRDAIDRTTDVVTKPIYFGETQSARWRAMWHTLLSRRKTSEES